MTSSYCVGQPALEARLDRTEVLNNSLQIEPLWETQSGLWCPNRSGLASSCHQVDHSLGFLVCVRLSMGEGARSENNLQPSWIHLHLFLNHLSSTWTQESVYKGKKCGGEKKLRTRTLLAISYPLSQSLYFLCGTCLCFLQMRKLSFREITNLLKAHS